MKHPDLTMFIKTFILIAALAMVSFSLSQMAEAQEKCAGTIRIAILGDSRSSKKDHAKPLNEDVLGRLLDLLNKDEPQAIFFTGDLTLGFKEEEEPSDGKMGEEPVHSPGDGGWKMRRFIYEPAEYERQLAFFSDVVRRHTKGTIPLYPVVGNHEAVGADSVKVFVEHFGLRNLAPLDPAYCAYKVRLGNSLFVVLATEYFSLEEGKMKEHVLSGSQMAWLEKVLSERPPEIRHTFVVGHEPAFSVRGFKEKEAVGIDRFPEIRDAFWGILRKYGVKAYICSHEHLYHCQKQKGVWQIISGGAGANLAPAPGGFNHYLMLTIPQGRNGQPSFSVVDMEGKVREIRELR
jgi:3',5'-cyclic AMP phosphodiesterase CpdA